MVSNPPLISIFSCPLSKPLGTIPNTPTTIAIISSFILNWIPMTRKSGKPYTQHTETLDSFFTLIKSHQQCITWSPPLEIELVTTDCRAETLQLSQQFISHTSDAKKNKKKLYLHVSQLLKFSGQVQILVSLFAFFDFLFVVH